MCPLRWWYGRINVNSMQIDQQFSRIIIIKESVNDFFYYFRSAKNGRCYQYISNQFSNYFFVKYLVRTFYFNSDMVAILCINTTYILKITVNFVMGQSIQEWTKWNLWKTTFKKLHSVHSWILCPKCLCSPGKLCKSW